MDSRPNSDLLERSMPSGMLKIRNLDTNELFRYELADTMCPKPQTFDDCPPKRLVQLLAPTPESSGVLSALTMRFICSLFSVTIAGAEKDPNGFFYSYLLFVDHDGEEWVIKRRYRDFSELHEKVFASGMIMVSLV